VRQHGALTVAGDDRYGSHARSRMEDGVENIAAFLAKTVLFSVVPPVTLPAIAKAATRVTIAKGETLFEAGSAGDAIFLVRSGLLQIVSAVALGGEPLGEAARGEHLGEMAVLTGEPRAASVVAVVESVLYALPGDLVRALFQEYPILWARLSLGLMRNLQTQGRSRARGVRTCAVVGAGTAGGRSLALTLALAEELRALGGEPVAVLDCVPAAATPVSESPPELPGAFSEVTQTLRRLVTPAAGASSADVTMVRLGSDCAADAPVADLVAELRRRHARVLVHATLPWSPLAARGIAQCDALRWVVDGGDATAGVACTTGLQDLAALVRMPPVPRVLAFAAPVGPARAAGDVGGGMRVVPVEEGADAVASLSASAARRVLRAVARELAGQRTALVLGAGGAKGFAHVGALKAFERHGVEFDAVAGTSIGAIVGALVAMGWSAATIEALFMGVANNPWKTLFDLRVPTEAFFRSKKKSELIAQYCSGIDIDQMGLPFFAVAGDLASLTTVVFQHGPLALALDASSAIPTVFRPIRHEDRMLVDGWVCDPLPAGVVRAAGFERVIAIDLSPRGRPSGRRPAATATPPGLGGRLRILAIAMRAMELASQEHVARSLPLIDVLVRPDLDGFSSADLEGAAEMSIRGEHAAEEAMPAIRG
jgi:NTE family protein